ncbi:uncharacterized protein [Nicotiana tomentosiformis]|uniref:uncharacterized protein n=1 Tax=Nicotiana tomentosiformis TaxID=4098 RepID=UPI00388C907F
MEGKTLEKLKDSTLSKSIAGLALRTVILEIESSRREDRRKAIFQKMEQKYREYSDKHRELCWRVGGSSNFQALRNKLKEKDDELVKLEECQLRAAVLSGEVAEKVADLERAETAQLSVARRAAALEDAICVNCSERDCAMEMARLREDRLDERIGELEKKTADLSDRVIALEAEKAQLLA